ncbi:MAG TPA: hypothetical protein VGO04_24715 [Ensifer sp.]|uniref:hypothetical protein n=1 Tax=Ensifer sp. TaxID=1872086 RepID=UPI002E125A4B|nr:hypothetical protein [Ensifer sp.]
MSSSQVADVRGAEARAARQQEGSGGGSISPMHADTHTDASPAVETPAEGRQGFLGMPVLAVLVGSLLLAGIAWLIVHYAVG